MGKYLTIESDVFSIIEDNLKSLTDAKIYPNNYIAVNPGKKFLKCSIISSGAGINLKSVSGLLIIDIFTPVGVGPRDASLIADTIDQCFAGKSKIAPNNSMTQFMGSNLTHRGVDPDNPALFRSSYSIPFNYFGV